MDIISYEDTSEVCYDPHEEKYWDKASLDKELERTFEICHGCRLCFKFCPSFPSLFNAVDREDGDVRKITPADTDKVIGECFQCKLCYINCPYTKTDGHAYNLDFPSLIQRAVHQNADLNGISLRDRILQDSDKAGKMNTGLLSGLVNISFLLAPVRWIIQLVLGIHRKKLMPQFHRRSFASWFNKRAASKIASPTDKVVLFSTCFVNYNNPEVGKDTVEVLEKSGVEVLHPEQNCCGMPALNSGDLKFAEKKMKANIESLLPYAEQGFKILAINPTCSMTLKKEYPLFMAPGEWRDKAQKISNATRDVNEYLFELKKEEKFNKDFKSTPGKIAYHVPCHLRAQNIGFRSRDMMKQIPDAKITPITECCGHDGTWAMKKEYFELSLQAGKRAFDGMNNANANCMTSDCPLAAVQLKQGTNSDEMPSHPVQMLAKAYRAPDAGGFTTPIEEGEHE